MKVLLLLLPPLPFTLLSSFGFLKIFFIISFIMICVCAGCECFVKLLLCCSLSVVLSYFVGSSGFVVSIFLFFTKT